MKSQTKTFLVWAVLILAVVGLAHMFSQSQQVSQRTYAEFVRDVEDNAVEFKDTVLDIKLHKTSVDIAYEQGGRAFEIVGPDSDELFALLSAKHINYKVEPQEEGIFLQFAVMWLPLILLVVIMMIFLRQMQAGGGKAMSFGKSKARMLNEHTQKVTFKDVAGIEEAREECEEIIDFLRDTRKYLRVGGRIPKGVLLMGPPGTGKTLLARAIAGEAGVAFFSISGSDFVEMFVGVGASRVRDLFEQGKKNAPCIIFIDEIDAVGRHRGAGLGGGHDEREQTLNQLLVEMDGFEGNDGVILVAATNRPDVLDPALLRPGRFDRRIVVGLPNLHGREAILKVHTRKTPLSEDVDLKAIARGVPGFSGADLENLINEAALLAARYDRDRVTMADLERAKDKVMIGAERQNVRMSEHEKSVTAWHEAGHALVAALLPKGLVDPFHKVTIIPRGQTLGVTVLLPVEERLSLTAKSAKGMIALSLGGLVAEELRFEGQRTSGASNDIQKASAIARKMVCEWGMSTKMGPMTFGTSAGEPFLGRDIGQTKNYSEATAQAIDQEVHDIIDGQYQMVTKLLGDQFGMLKSVAESLIEREVLDAKEVAALMAGEKLPPQVLPEPMPAPTLAASGDSAAKAPESQPRAPGFPNAEPA